METYYKTPDGLTDRDFTFENPYDLAPANDIFAQAVEREIALLEPGQPLVILSGEVHPRSLDRSSQISELMYLKKARDNAPNDPRRKFLFAHEIPFNISSGVARFLSLDLQGNLNYEPEKIDPENLLMIDFMASQMTSADAPIALLDLYRFVRQNAIPTVFNDSARISSNKKSYIDLRDPLLLYAWQAYCKNNPGSTVLKNIEELDCMSLKGSGMRHFIQAKRALEKAKELQARIVFQAIGIDHIFGGMCRDGKSKLKNSLSCVYEDAGARVLPLIRPDFSTISLEGIRRFPNTLVYRGLDIQRFYNPDFTASSTESHKEREYLENLERHYNGTSCPFARKTLSASTPSKRHIRSAFRRNLRNHSSLKSMSL